jgi:hypothetical protein
MGAATICLEMLARGRAIRDPNQLTRFARPSGALRASVGAARLGRTADSRIVRAWSETG